MDLNITPISYKTKRVEQTIPIYLNGKLYDNFSTKYHVRKNSYSDDELNKLILIGYPAYTYKIKKSEKLIRILSKLYEIKMKYFSFKSGCTKMDNGETIQYYKEINITLPDVYYSKWLSRKRDEYIKELIN